MSYVLLIHVFSCCFMTGVIWLVQLVVYPFFKLIGQKEFHQIHQYQMKQISWLVAPLMTLELVTGAWLFYHAQNQIFFLNLTSILFLWLLTGAVNVPTHNKLTFESEQAKKNLVLRNWPRTLIWSSRSVSLILFIVKNSQWAAL